MKFRKGIICCILIIMFVSGESIYVNADNNNQNNTSVVISTDINKILTKKYIEGVVTVQFNDSSLYSENVKLSYHIYDKNNNIIVFENERIPLNVEDGIATSNITINLDEIEGVAELKHCIIKFDLVDEQNVYWFVDNEFINMETVDVQYSDIFLYRVEDKYGFILRKQQFQLLSSIGFILVAIILYNKYKKFYN